MKNLILISYVLAMALTTHAQQSNFPSVSGPYLGQSLPGKVPVRFAPNILTQTGIFGISFSPDGGTCVYSGNYLNSVKVFTLQEIEGGWSVPAVAPFCSDYMDSEPHYTITGDRVIFGSTRPLTGNASSGLYSWQVEKTLNGWSAARTLDPPLRDIPMMYPSLAKNNNLYFTDVSASVTSQDNPGIGMSQWIDGVYSQPVSVGSSINTYRWPGHPFIGADESYLIFDAVVREQGSNFWRDLFISFRLPDGSWDRPLKLGSQINQIDGNEMSGFVSRNERYFFFSRGGVLYWCDASFIEMMRPIEIDSTEQIVFSSTRDGNSELYRMLEDGSEVVRITQNSAGDTDPAFSKDGSAIVFISDRDGNPEVYSMSPEGNFIQRLTNNGATESSPLFSPDGTWIAFVRESGAGSCIYKIRTDGSQETLLAESTSRIMGISWSPAGDQIAFASAQDGNYDIYTINSNEINAIPMQITFTPENEQYPAWSPDGARIVFQSYLNGVPDKTAIHSIKNDGSDILQLTEADGLNHQPVWSPDGNSIVFSSNRDGNAELIRINSDGSRRRKLTDNPADDEHPFWIQYSPISTIGEAGSLNNGLRIITASPNPVGFSTMLSFSTSHLGMHRLEILNGSGNLINSFDILIDEPGCHSQMIDLSDTPSGILIARLSFEGFNCTHKFVKL